MWGNAVERVKKLRSRHTVWPTEFRGPGMVCHHDGVRIQPHGKYWRHDTRAMARLNDEAAAIAQPSQL